MIENVSVTYSSSSARPYIFTLELSEMDIEGLRYKKLFGCINVVKNKYEFLNDLRDIITEELLVKLEEIADVQTKL